MLQALLIYCKIDIEAKIKEFGQPTILKPTSVKLKEVEKELKKNRKLIEITSGNEDGGDDEGSDSGPSEDNLEEQELALIVPLSPKIVEELPIKKISPKKPPEIKMITMK